MAAVVDEEIICFSILFVTTVLVFMIVNGDALTKDIRVKVYQHTLSWDILPFVGLDWHDKGGRGWRLTLGWLCYTVEIDYEFIPF